MTEAYLVGRLVKAQLLWDLLLNSICCDVWCGRYKQDHVHLGDTYYQIGSDMNCSQSRAVIYLMSIKQSDIVIITDSS